MRLGEAMVKEGLITNGILAKALERQIIFGGRLGTNLVEMGAINEETLARFLSRELKVPYADPSSFQDVPQEVLDGMPRELAEKYTAFPIKRERSRIHLAMKDPNDIALLDELRFIVGLDIRPYIASEMRIVFALEKYYGIKRDLRYVAVQGEDNTFDRHLGVPSAAGPAHAPGPAPVKEVREEDYLGDESQTEVNVRDIFDEPAPAEPRAAAPAPLAQAHEFAQPAPPPQPQPPAPQPQYQAPPPPPPPQPAAKPPERPQPIAAPEPAQAKSPYQVLAAPGDREQIAGAVIQAALADVSRAALFMVKGQLLTGWRASGGGLTDHSISAVRINLGEPTVFKDVVEDKLYYKGPILQLPQNKALLDSMGGAVPQEAVAYPLIIKGKVVGVLYGDNGQGSMLTGNMDRLGGLMAKASMSLEILILKTKILAEE